MDAIPNEILQQAYKRRPLYLIKLPFFYGLIFLLAWLATWATAHTSHGVLVAVLCGLAMSTFVRGLGSIGHDAAHGCVSRNKYVSYVVGVLAWSSTMFPFTVYRNYHLDHHRIVNMPHDIDRVQTSRFTSNAPLARFLRMAIYTLFYTVYYTREVQRYRASLPPLLQVRAWLEFAAIGVFLASMCYLMGPAAFVPMFLSSTLAGMFVVSTTSMLEHFGIEYHPDHAYSSRTYATQSRLIDFLWSGTNFHNEHHKYPGIPYYNLRSFHFAALPYYSDRVKKNVHPNLWGLAFVLWKRASELELETELAAAARDRSLIAREESTEGTLEGAEPQPA